MENTDNLLERIATSLERIATSSETKEVLLASILDQMRKPSNSKPRISEPRLEAKIQQNLRKRAKG